MSESRIDGESVTLNFHIIILVKYDPWMDISTQKLIFSSIKNNIWLLWGSKINILSTRNIKFAILILLSPN